MDLWSVMAWSVLLFRGTCAITTGVTNAATKTIPYAACAAMVYALVANLYPVTHDVYGKLPYVFLAYLMIVVLLFVFRSREKPLMQEGS